MTVEELIEELKQMSPTAVVFVLAPLSIDDRPVFERAIEGMNYETGRVIVNIEP